MPACRPGLSLVLIAVLLLAAAFLPVAASAARAPRSAQDTLRLGPVDKARMLHRWAEEDMADPAVEARQRTTRDLEEAIRLDPTNGGYWLTLARVQQLGGFDREARECLDRAVRLDPRNPRSRRKASSPRAP